MDFTAWYGVSRIWAWIAFLAGMCGGLMIATIFFSPFYSLLFNKQKKQLQEFNYYKERQGERGKPIE